MAVKVHARAILAWITSAPAAYFSFAARKTAYQYVRVKFCWLRPMLTMKCSSKWLSHEFKHAYEQGTFRDWGNAPSALFNGLEGARANTPVPCSHPLWRPYGGHLVAFGYPDATMNTWNITKIGYIGSQESGMRQFSINSNW